METVEAHMQVPDFTCCVVALGLGLGLGASTAGMMTSDAVNNHAGIMLQVML